MSEAFKLAPIAQPKPPYPPEVVTAMLDEHHVRLAAIEEIGETIIKIYEIAKKGGLLILGTMALGANPNSPIGQLIIHLNTLLPK